MDEASIVSALQADLQNYKVKTQIRRKESQLHILLTRDEGDDVDYASLYDIVKRRIDKLPIEGADSLIVYGRLAGAKHPEWQKDSEIKPPLPLIELDLEELENFRDDNLGHLTLVSAISIDANADNDNSGTGSNEIEIQSNNAIDLTEPQVTDELASFKNSIERDLKIANGQRGQDYSYNSVDHASDLDSNLIESKDENFDLVNLDPQEPQSKNFQATDFELESLEKDLTIPQPNKQELPLATKLSWEDEDFNLNASTVLAVPMPLPPPINKRTVEKVAEAPTKEPVKTAILQYNNGTIFSVLFVLVAVSIVGVCGWLMWDRFNQQQSLANARNFSNQDISLKKITKLAVLTETRNRLQTIVFQLEAIPNRPISLYTEAQNELKTLQPQLGEFDRKVNIEQLANKNLESAKAITLEAATLTQNSPHKSSIWQAAQLKREQALKMLEVVPNDSLLYADAQKRLTSYRAELVQIKKWVEIQQASESLVPDLNPVTINQLKQLKTKVSEKPKFINQCQSILQPQISSTDAQKVGTSIANVTTYLCGYFWS